MTRRPVSVTQAERIVAVAIKMGTVIVTAAAPARHGHIIHAIYNLNRKHHILPSDQGFLTTLGRFVDRREARMIADIQGQVTSSGPGFQELFSEDVW